MAGVLLTSFVLRQKETGRFHMLLTLTAGPGGGHTLMEGPRRVVPVGSADAELRLADVSVTVSQFKKDPFYSAQGSGGKPRSPRRKLLSPIMGDWFSSAALTKGWIQHAVVQAAPHSSMWKWPTAVMNIKPPLICSQTWDAATPGRKWTLDAGSVGWCAEGLDTSGSIPKLQEKFSQVITLGLPGITELPFIHLCPSLSLPVSSYRRIRSSKNYNLSLYLHPSWGDNSSLPWIKLVLLSTKWRDPLTGHLRQLLLSHRPGSKWNICHVLDLVLLRGRTAHWAIIRLSPLLDLMPSKLLGKLLIH